MAMSNFRPEVEIWPYGIGILTVSLINKRRHIVLCLSVSCLLSFFVIRKISDHSSHVM